MADMQNKYDEPNLTKKQMTDMQADFAEHFKKHASTQNKLMHILNDPEYMHELQLLSEHYASDPKNSAEYLKATREVLYKYIPEMRQADKEMAAISQKYESNSIK